MFTFKPNEIENNPLPYFDDVKASDGWEGQTTGKSIEKLQQEIAENLSRLGCVYTGCRSGSYGNRLGFQIHFAMKSASGGMIPSRLDIACLPINPRKRTRRPRRSYRPIQDIRQEATQKMALYMVNKAIKGMYFLSVLSPAFVPFLSQMLNSEGKTLGQLWATNENLALLSPPTDGDFVDGEVVK